LKQATVVLLLCVLLTVPALATSFCDGFDAGYKAGYKQASGAISDPMPPACPMAPAQGLNDPQSDYEYGDTIGFRRGYADGSR